MSLISKILEREEFRQKPPVLLDVGASVNYYMPWSVLAPYSICIAFDADSREMAHASDKTHPYKKLYLHPSIAIADNSNETDFFLTKAPVCSSTLEPDKRKLDRWSHSEMFLVSSKTRIKSENLSAALKGHGLTYIDWFKTDSQGTDLRLFKSLDNALAKKILVADFEPGIISAYKAEDKAWQVIAHMETLPFWMTTMNVRGVRRLGTEERTRLNPEELRAFQVSSSESPGWAEISYFNTFEDANFGMREYLLLWIFASIKGQDGYALEIAYKGEKKFKDPIFTKLQIETKNEVAKKYRYAVRANSMYKLIHTIKKVGKAILHKFS